jgi:predicted methyltransferase
MRYAIAFAAVATLFAVTSTPLRADPAPGNLNAALTWVERPPFEMALDPLLKPREVLTLAGVRPGMKVMDLMPDSGYYMRILSGTVGAKGKVYAVIPRSNGVGGPQNPGPRVKEFGEGQERDRLDRVARVNQVNVSANTWIMSETVDGNQYPDDLRYGNIALPEQLDLVVTAFDYHVFKSPEFSRTDMNRFLSAIYRNLNNGGVMMVLDNRAASGMSLADAVQLNRMDPEVVKAEMTKAGFVFDSESNILARSDDDRTQPAEDVFLTRTPKPADVFVLKFRKPIDAPDTNQRPKDPLKLMKGFFGNSIVVSGGDISIHFIHEDGTYQELRNAGFDSGQWFFNVDGWNCRYRPAGHNADCANSPHEYDNRKVGDVWQAPHGRYEVVKGYNYWTVLHGPRAPGPGTASKPAARPAN